MKIISLKPVTYDFLIDNVDTTLAESTEDEWLESETYASGAVLKASFGSSVDGDREVFTATSGQTLFTFAHIPGEIDVYKSGVEVIKPGGYTETSADMTLLSGAALGTKVEIIKTGDDDRVAPIKLYEKTSTVTNTYPPGDDGTNWLDTGATNRWGMFDQFVTTSSASTIAAVSGTPSTYSVKINSSKADYIGLFNVGASQIDVQYENTFLGALTDYNPTNFHVRCDQDYHPFTLRRNTLTLTDYFFGAFIFKSSILIPIPKDLVSYVKITFTESRVGYFASCGMCVAGVGYDIGKTQYGASASILSFSRKERNDYFGYTYLKKGNFAKKMDLDINVDNEKYTKVYNVLAAADGVPAIFQGNNNTDYEPFLIYGFVVSFDMILEYLNMSECTLEVEGLI